MTHDELSKKLEGLWHDSYKAPGYMMLRAVVELHKPYDFTHTWSNETHSYCSSCKIPIVDCPTIQAIEEQLDASRKG